jgi:hypothetical protein
LVTEPLLRLQQLGEEYLAGEKIDFIGLYKARSLVI